MMDYSNDIKLHLKEIEERIRGILHAMEENKDCVEVIQHLSSARKIVDELIEVIVGRNLETCIVERIEKGEAADNKVDEAIQLLVKSW